MATSHRGRETAALFHAAMATGQAGQAGGGYGLPAIWRCVQRLYLNGICRSQGRDIGARPLPRCGAGARAGFFCSTWGGYTAFAAQYLPRVGQRYCRFCTAVARLPASLGRAGRAVVEHRADRTGGASAFACQLGLGAVYRPGGGAAEHAPRRPGVHAMGQPCAKKGRHDRPQAPSGFAGAAPFALVCQPGVFWLPPFFTGQCVAGATRSSPH